MTPKKMPKTTDPQPQGPEIKPSPRAVKNQIRKEIKNQIRKDIRDMYQKNSRIDKKEIESRFIVLHPQKADFICRVVNE
jgi:hypothetical protein